MVIMRHIRCCFTHVNVQSEANEAHPSTRTDPPPLKMHTGFAIYNSRVHRHP